jgi:hypothetical protein
VNSKGFYLYENGTKSSLTDTQKNQIITQLSTLSTAQLERIKQGGIRYGVVDPAHAPSSVRWPSGSGAYYDIAQKTVYLDQSRLNHLVIHESIHALDNLDAQSGQTWASTTDAGLQQAFADYVKRTATDPTSDWDAIYNRYAARNILEFAAEAGRTYLESDATRNMLLQKDPETYYAIQNFLNSVAA